MATDAPIQTTITPETIAAAQVEFDEQDRAVLVTGRERTLLTFQVTGVLASDLLPREWEEVAAWILKLVDHDPIKSSKGFVAHRVLLGSFANDLRSYARQSGEPVGLEADLRAAGSKAEERRIQARIDDEHRALERHLDDVALQQARQHPAPATDDPATQEEPIDQPEPTKTDDDAWLL